jgi:dihydroflavonol-4-reductase
MSKRAMVTGATGFVGANLVRRLLERGFRVRVLARGGSDRRLLEGLDLEYARGDVRDLASMETAFRACDVVFHAAAYVSMFVPDPSEMRRVNVEGTANVLAAARKAGVPRVVITSTVSAVAGSFDPQLIANEETPFNLGRRGFHYCITKHAAEEVAREAAAGGQDVVIVNPASMFGAYDIRPNIGRMIVAVVQGSVPAYVHGGSNYVDVGDVCEGHIRAYERGRAGERYILGNENLTHQDVFARIASLVGGKPPRIRVPYPLALAGGALGELGGKVTGREPHLDLTIARMSRYYFYFSHAKAANELAYRPGSLDASILRAHEWLKSNGYLD